MIPSKTPVTLAAITALGLSLVPNDSSAQHGHEHSSSHSSPSSGGWDWGSVGNFFGGSSQAPPNYGSPIVRQLNRKVLQIDDLANEMAYSYGREIRQFRSCKCSIALYGAMRKQTGLTGDLVKASKGNCTCAFKQAAGAVRLNMDDIHRLKRTAKVSCTVNGLIDQSCQLASFVKNNASRWEPAPDFRTLRQISKNINEIGMLTEEMVARYAYEIQRIRACQCSRNLFIAMQAHTRLVDNLDRANRGTCKTSFIKSANAVRSNLDKIQTLQRAAQVSRTVKGLISDSCPPSSYVKKNASKWAPSYNSRPAYSSQRGSRSNRGGGHNSHSHDNSSWGNLLSRFRW